VLGGPDGFCYGFDPLPVPAAAGQPTLKELWRCDCNPPAYRTKAGKPLKYKTPEGPSEVIATPVVSGGRIYATIGQDPEYGDGAGALVCINPSGAGDISKQGIVWSYTKISRSLSTPSVADGLVYVGDYKGILHCVDAATGKPLWVYDTKSRIWGSTLVADGKVYLGTEDGDLIILQAGKVLKEIRKVDMRSPIYSSPVAAGGTVYVATPTHLYALGKLN
jgi:outer membrane protein assembly factor BamB